LVGSRKEPITKEGLIMDPHFHEYLAAVAGMHDVYGGPLDEGPSDFHGDEPVEGLAEQHESLATACCDVDCCGVA
jgi:hypothetical protein